MPSAPAGHRGWQAGGAGVGSQWRAQQAQGLAGILVTIWCGLRGWPKDVQRTVFQPVAVAIFLMSALWNRRERRDHDGGRKPDAAKFKAFL